MIGGHMLTMMGSDLDYRGTCSLNHKSPETVNFVYSTMNIVRIR